MGRVLFLRLGLRPHGRHGKIQLAPENGALARLALHPDLAAHHQDKLADNGQPQAGAAILSGGGAVGLGKALEQVFLLFRGNADAGITHFNAQHHPGSKGGQTPHPNPHLALMGELDGVGHEIGQHLPHPGRVAKKHLGQLGIDLGNQSDTLGLGLAVEQSHQVFHQCAQTEGNVLEQQFVRSNLGKIEDIVQNGQQRFR